MYFESDLALALLYLSTVIELVQEIVNRDQSSLNRYIHLCKYPWVSTPTPPQPSAPPLVAKSIQHLLKLLIYVMIIISIMFALVPAGSNHRTLRSSYYYLYSVDNFIVIIRNHLCHRFLNVIFIYCIHCSPQLDFKFKATHMLFFRICR